MKIKELQEGAPVTLQDLDAESKETAPPGRYSEVQLAKVLTDKGIGRPSTLSSIISTIQDRGYVVRKGSQLYPTALGFAIARLLSNKLPNFVKYDYTAEMEEELDEIAEGKQDRVSFLKEFWSGPSGFEAKINQLLDGGLTLDEIKEYGKIDLHNGYAVRFSRFGTFIEDLNGEPNEKGYLPSAKIDDNDDLWQYRDPKICKKLLEKAATATDSKELGTLTEGHYKGWTVTAREGRFGPYLQASSPELLKILAEGKKPTKKTPQPVNQKLPKDLTIETVTLAEAAPLFQEVRLPRWSNDKLWLVGVGKKGPYMGRKSSAKARPIFKKLPEGDPKTISFERVKELWQESA